MPKKLERNELEWLRSQNKALRSENRHLKKELGRADKKVKNYETHIDEEAEIEAPIEMKEQEEILKCSKCMGIIEVVDLGARKLITCSGCGNRKTLKK